jgi:hypothetical protein
MLSNGALISMALETNTVEGMRIEKKSMSTNRATMLIRINFRKRILFPLKGFKSHYIYYYCPDSKHAKFLPATGQASSFKSNIAHSIVEMG